MAKLYSHSRLNIWENCPKKFELRYRLGIPEETEGIEGFVGKRVHEILERLYEFVAKDQVPSLRRVIERFDAIFDENYDANRVKIVKDGYDIEYYRALGHRCLQNYYRSHYPFDQDETLGLETHIQFNLDPEGRYGIQGFVDRIVRAQDGAIEIQDYKTGEYIPNQKRIDADRQLALYQIGIGRRFGDAPVRLVWQYLSKGITRVSTRSAEALEQLQENTLALIERIEAADQFPAKKTNLCRWCTYKPLCPAFGASEEAALEKAQELRQKENANQPRLL